MLIVSFFLVLLFVGGEEALLFCLGFWFVIFYIEVVIFAVINKPKEMGATIASSYNESFCVVGFSFSGKESYVFTGLSFSLEGEAFSLLGMSISNNVAENIFGIAISKNIAVSTLGLAISKSRVSYIKQGKRYTSLIGISPKEISIFWMVLDFEVIVKKLRYSYFLLNREKVKELVRATF